MADNYQIVRNALTGMGLVNWVTLPVLMASIVRNPTNSVLPSSLQVLPGCDLTQLNTLLTQWRQQNGAPIVLATGGSSQAFAQVAPNWPVQIQISRQGNTLVVTNWTDALKVADWTYLNSSNTTVLLNA